MQTVEKTCEMWVKEKEFNFISVPIKVVFAIDLRFKHPVGDLNYPVILEKAELSILRCYSLNIDYSKDDGPDSKKSDEGAYIWKLCEENLCYWFANQPYNKIPHLADRLGDTQINRANRVYGVVYIVPGKKSSAIDRDGPQIQH